MTAGKRPTGLTSPRVVATLARALAELLSATELSNTLRSAGLEPQPGTSKLARAEATLRLYAHRPEYADAFVALVRRVFQEARRQAAYREMNDLPDPSIELIQALRREGYEVRGDDIVPLGAAAAPFPALQGALESKVKQASLQTALAHLDEAADTLAQGQYGACAAAIRSFLQEVFDQWAARVDPAASHRPPGGERRKLLEDRGHLSPEEAAVVRAFFAWLSQSGPHPGIPPEPEVRAKLHMAVALADLVLSRMVT